jgi:hypothetical protein
MRSTVHTRVLGDAEISQMLNMTRLGYHRAVAALASVGNDVIMAVTHRELCLPLTLRIQPLSRPTSAFSVRRWPPTWAATEANPACTPDPTSRSTIARLAGQLRDVVPEGRPFGASRTRWSRRLGHRWYGWW